jgi:hypothetical protein
VAVVCELVAAGVSEHVGMGFDPEIGRHLFTGQKSFATFAPTGRSGKAHAGGG